MLVDGIEVHNGSTLLRVTAITDDILRVRMSGDGSLPEDASWAVLPQMRGSHVAVAALAGDSARGFRTRSLVVQIDPASLRLVVEDIDGRVVSADAPQQPLSTAAPRSNCARRCRRPSITSGSATRPAPLDRRGATSSTGTPTSAASPQPPTRSTRSIPFFIGIGGDGGSYGLFLDNTLAQLVRFRPARRGHAGDRRRWRADRLLRDRRPDRAATSCAATPTSPAGRRCRRSGRWATSSRATATCRADEVRDDRRAPAQRAHPDRRDLAGHRLPGPQPALHRQHEDLSRPAEAGRGHATPRASAWSRSPTCTSPTCRTRATCPTTAAPPATISCTSRRRQHLRRRRSGRARRCSPISPARRRATGGAACIKDFVDDGIAGFWNDMNEPAVFETPTKTMPLEIVHRIDSDDFARARRDACRDPQRLRHGEHARDLRRHARLRPGRTRRS